MAFTLGQDPRRGLQHEACQRLSKHAHVHVSSSQELIFCPDYAGKCMDSLVSGMVDGQGTI